MANQKRKCLLRSSEKKKANKTCLIYLLSLALQWWRGIRKFAANFLFLNHISYTSIYFEMITCISASFTILLIQWYYGVQIHVSKTVLVIIFCRFYMQEVLSRLLKSFACCKKGELDLSMTWFLDLIIFDKTFWTHFLKKGWKSNKLKNSSSYRY